MSGNRIGKIAAIVIVLAVIGILCFPPLSSLHTGDIVYIREDTESVPFIVTAVNGDVLLMRKDLLPGPRKIGKDSYYKDSEIDKYLNGEYLDTLNVEPVSHRIDIVSGDEVEMIDRKVFLPAIFENPEKSATLNGEPQSWWLRTAYSEDETYAVRADGRLDKAKSDELNGIRPMIALPCGRRVVRTMNGYRIGG